VDRIEETFRPGFRLGRLKHHGVALLADKDGWRQVNAFWQADDLLVI
jgi:hypothetical protein